ncbi:TPA: restriction endonuclease subunit S [Klebsiella quasipneumoniae subsp. quasipneumoniae]|nr:restriction endonuclease subunit S [Klebsiella quasipneumoniae]HCI6507337.1 restriction endonuclease subunit S [Klebsiella quasipneumoniae subsp. quasipneumoniae]
MAKYKAYPEYKDSGVEWFDVRPLSWKVTRLKLETFMNMGQSPSSDDCNIEGDGLAFLQGNAEFGKVNPIEKQYCPVAKKIANTGDILFSVRAPVGAMNFADKKYGIGRGLCSISASEKVTSPFLWWLLPTYKYQLDAIATGSTFEAVSAEQLGNLCFALPSISEQSQIAAFLDHETTKIDDLIEKQQQLIELLKEKRQAVISHAVTKGLNPDVPMKDSGVEWLGELPSHWQALPTKRLFRLVAEPAEINNDYELLSVYTAIGVAPRKDLEPKGNKASTTDGYWKVRQGDIIVNKLLAWMGAVGFSNYDGVTSPAYDILRKVKDINPKFYHYLFRLELTQREFKRWSRGIMEMRLRLYFEELGRIIMPVPPRQEQDVIVEEIEKIEHQYSQLENIASHQIDLLQERRTALISAAVTGKIDVRDWIAPDTQDVEESQEATA